MSKMNSLFKRMTRLIVVLVLISVTFSYAMFQGGFVSWFLFYSTIPLFFYSVVLAIVPIQLGQVERIITPAILQRGDTVLVTVRFENRTWWFPLLFMTVQEVGIDKSLNQQANTIFFVGWKKKFEWTYTIEDLQRGKYSFHTLRFTISDFFGWIIRQKEVHAPQTILVFPKITELNDQPLQLLSKSNATTPFSIHKDTTNVVGVRDYQAGDRFSWIHWKSFAKNETLQTKEFEEVQSKKLLLIIDRTTEKSFEETVELTASIIQSVVNQRRELSFLSLGEDRFLTKNIKPHNIKDVMNHLAIVKPDANEQLDALLAKEMQLIRSTTLLVITSELSEQLVKVTQFGLSIICLLLVETQNKEQFKRANIHPNIKVVPINQDNFRDVFTEVMKP